jgi:glutaredoxin 3
MNQATLYTTAICPYCIAAKNYLRNRGIGYEEVRVDLDPVRREEMLAKARRTSVPQIFFGDVHVGGFDDLVAADRRGELARLAGAVRP